MELKLKTKLDESNICCKHSIPSNQNIIQLMTSNNKLDNKSNISLIFMTEIKTLININ